MFHMSEKIFANLEEDEKEPEMLDQRELLADNLGIEIDDDDWAVRKNVSRPCEKGEGGYFDAKIHLKGIFIFSYK